MRDLAIPAGERSEGRRRGLGRAKAVCHEPGRRCIERCIEVAADDRRRAVRPAVDPCQKLLNLKEAQGIVATRHVEVGYVEIDGPLLDHDAGDQRDDPGELYPRVGFIVTNLARSVEGTVAFYNQRGTAEPYIKEGRNAIKWTRLSCRSFAANAGVPSVPRSCLQP